MFSLAEPNSPIHRHLSKEEEVAFRVWARIHYGRMDDIKGTWHPVVQSECVKINAGIPADSKITY